MKVSVSKLGLFWTFFEPLVQTAFFIAIHAALSQRHMQSVKNYDIIVFMAVGFIAFSMFRNILNSTKGAFSANRGLLQYKQVKPIDTILARVLLNVFITVLIACIFLFIGFLFQYNIEAENILFVILGYSWLIIFSFSIGLVVAIGNHFYVGIGKFVGIISFMLMFSSAIFYSVADLPSSIQHALLYNPLVHFMEFIHASYLPELTDKYVDFRYMFLWTVTPLFMGLWLYIRLEKKIISS